MTDSGKRKVRMLGAGQKYQIKDGIRMGLIGLVMGMLVFFSADNYLMPFYYVSGDILEQQDFFHVIFFWDNFQDRVYMSRTSMDFLSVALFYFLPAGILAVRHYAEAGKEYYGFLAVRSGNAHDLLKRILGKQWMPFLVYTYAYAIGAVLCIKVKYPDIPCRPFRTTVACLGLFGISRAMALNLFSHILFWIYLKWNAGIAVFSGYIIMPAVLLADANVESVNICLFHYENYFMDSIAILSVCSVAVYLAERRMKIRI